MGAIEGTVPTMGGGGEISPGEMLFGGGAEEQLAKDTEWEVCRCYLAYLLGETGEGWHADTTD